MASVQSAMGFGGVVGGLLLSTWGGPKRRIHGVLAGFIWASLAQVVMGSAQSVWLWSAAGFAAFFSIPIINGASQAIWQAKVAPDVQGRVFGTRRMLAQLTNPVGMLLAGPLADYVFEPAMQPGAPMARLFGEWFGAGPGAGMGLLIALAGVLGVGVGVVSYALPVIRRAEDLLPDHDQPAADIAPADGSDCAAAPGAPQAGEPEHPVAP